MSSRTQPTRSVPWVADSHAPTPSLSEFLAEYEGDSNLWWRMSCGHHQDLFESAVDEVVAQRIRAETAEEVIGKVIAVIRHARKISPTPTMAVYVADLENAVGIEAARPHKLGQRDG